MTSRRALTLFAIIVWAAVAVTAAPSAFSHHRSVPIAISAVDFPAESCSDLRVRFDHHQIGSPNPARPCRFEWGDLRRGMGQG
jgi:hypothetical protein